MGIHDLSFHQDTHKLQSQLLINNCHHLHHNNPRYHFIHIHNHCYQFLRSFLKDHPIHYIHFLTVHPCHCHHPIHYIHFLIVHSFHCHIHHFNPIPGNILLYYHDKSPKIHLNHHSRQNFLSCYLRNMANYRYIYHLFLLFQ